MLKKVMTPIRDFAKDESGISGIVVAICLIVIGVLGGYYVYTKNLQPTLNGASSAGGAIQSSGATAATDFAGIQ